MPEEPNNPPPPLQSNQEGYDKPLSPATCSRPASQDMRVIVKGTMQLANRVPTELDRALKTLNSLKPK